MSVGTVICTWVVITCNSFHLIFKDQHIFCLSTNDNISIDSVCFQPFYLWVNRSSPNSTGYKQHLLILKGLKVFMNKLRSASKRTCKVTETVSGFEFSHFHCRSSNFLENDCDCSCFSVIITDCQRNTFAFLVHFNDDKLTRLTVTCYTWCMNIHQINLISQFFSF